MFSLVFVVILYITHEINGFNLNDHFDTSGDLTYQYHLSSSAVAASLDDDCAYLWINSSSYAQLILSMSNSECVKCKFIDTINITRGQNISVKINTIYPTYHLLVQIAETKEAYCTKYYKNAFTFGGKGVYVLNINGYNDCELIVNVEPYFVYLAIIIATAILGVIAVIIIGFKQLYHHFGIKKLTQVKSIYKSIGLTNSASCNLTVNTERVNDIVATDRITCSVDDDMNTARSSTIVTESETRDNGRHMHKTESCVYVSTNIEPLTIVEKQKQTRRLKSIDTFRGICLCIMIFVNYGAGGYALFDHVIWNGLHLADCVFPSFIFIMGASITLSMYSKISSGSFMSGYNDDLNGRNKAILKYLSFKIIKRSLLLFFFGLLTSNNYTVTLKDIRIMGILQRFSISYFVCAMLELLHLYLNNFEYNKIEASGVYVEKSFSRIIRDRLKEILFYPIQWLIILVFVVSWLLLTFVLPVPGCPKGYLGPGGIHDNGSYENCTGGSAGYIDRIILGKAHMFQWLSCRYMYQTKLPHDPEGLLGCLTSCILTYIGVSAGHMFINYKETLNRCTRFLTYSFLYGMLAAILCKFSLNDGWIPINKNLWSLSFVFGLAAIDFLVLTILYLTIDVWHLYSGKPFIFPGRNSICIYICHIVFANFFPIQFHVPNTHAYQVAMHIYGVVLWCFVSFIMDAKQISIKI